MLLANVSDILAALGFDPMTDITNAATMALDAAEAQLASVLNTDFDQQTITDTFFVRRAPFEQGQAFQTEFRLRRGLVTALTSVMSGYLLSDFVSGGSPINVTSSAMLLADRGVVQDFTNRYCDNLVQITYMAGFATDPNNPASYLISSVPDWLQQAAKLNALIGLADSPALSEAQIKLDVSTLKVQYNALLARKTRYAPLAILPL